MTNDNTSITQKLSVYSPLIISVVLIVAVAVLARTPIFGESRTAVPTVVATATVSVFIVTPTSSLDDQIQALRSQLATGNVPSMGAANNVAAAVAPAGALGDAWTSPKAMYPIKMNGETKMVETRHGEFACSLSAQGAWSVHTDNQDLAQWLSSQDPITQDNVAAACMQQ